MARVTIYLLDSLEAQARKEAEARGTTLSRWIAEQVKIVWRAEVRDTIGSFPDFPEQSELRRGYGKDSARERLD